MRRNNLGIRFFLVGRVHQFSSASSTEKLYASPILRLRGTTGVFTDSAVVRRSGIRTVGNGACVRTEPVFIAGGGLGFSSRFPGLGIKGTRARSWYKQTSSLRVLVLPTSDDRRNSVRRRRISQET